ncbi:MAG: DUF6537 domain-containing protein, partial [Rhodocyclaceae bacterium]
TYGAWMLNAFRWMARFKGLRGGALDLFSKTEERRTERALIEDYIGLLEQICSKLGAANHGAAVALASVPDEIRGYGHVKEKSIAAAKALQQQRLQDFLNPKAEKVAA